MLRLELSKYTGTQYRQVPKLKYGGVPIFVGVTSLKNPIIMKITLILNAVQKSSSSRIFLILKGQFVALDINTKMFVHKHKEDHKYAFRNLTAAGIKDF